MIGVARDTGTADLQRDLVDPTPQLFYRAFAQASRQPTAIVARTSLDATGAIALVGSMQRELRAVDANLPVVAAKTMTQYLEESLAAPAGGGDDAGRAGALGAGSCRDRPLRGGRVPRVETLARNRHPHGAGARGRQVVWTVTREVALLVSVGTAIGLGLSVLSIVAFRSLSAPAPGMTLYRRYADPLALAAIALFMTLVGISATSLPTWRAARIDPLKALRRD